MSAVLKLWMLAAVAPVLALGTTSAYAQALPAIDLRYATLRANGDAVALTYTVSCARSLKDASLSSYVTQRQGSKKVTASDYTYLNCTGRAQTVRVTASTYGSRSFVEGSAHVSYTLSDSVGSTSRAENVRIS
jgi:hypothetical protein